MSQPEMPSAIILAIKGLALNPSTFGYNPGLGNTAPPGSLSIANNVVIDRPSVVATRRGFDNTYATVTGGVSTMFQFNNVKYIASDDYKLYSDIANNGTLHTYTGDYRAPNYALVNQGHRIRSIETNKNLFFITDNGTYRLDSFLGTPRLAGVPPGLGGSGVVTGATGWFATNTQVAYRVVFGYRDANKQLVLGAPSSRIIVANTSGTNASVNLTFQFPKEIQASPSEYIFQVYRSGATANLTYEPNDELALVYEEVCSVPTMSATGSVTVSDITPASLVGALLYTNQSQTGILQSNFRPPWALDITTYKQYAFYANTRNAMTAALTLIASGIGNGADALQLGDTITFSENLPGTRTFTMTAIAGVNNPATGDFQLQDSGGTNPALDIQVTANNICLVANAMATNLFIEANYVSQYQEVPGKMIFNALSFSKTTFNVTSSRPTCWEQPLPVVSSNDERANRIYYSKFNQPEAVPVVNYMEVGSANQPINRILPIRNGVLVLKQDGVFFISSNTSPFNITPIDYNVRILAPNTAVELDNNIYFLSDQGVVALSDSAAGIKSYILDRTIIQNCSPDLFPNLKETAWGLAYQSDRKYILSMPTIGTDVQSTQQYVYNHLNDLWVRWTLAASCGLILKEDNKMYLGTASGSAPGTNQAYIYRERKSFSFDNTDYVDSEYTTNNTTAGATLTIVIDNPVMPTGISILPGWTVTQDGLNTIAHITAVDVGLTQTTLTLNRIQNWVVGDVTIWTPVYSEIQTIQIDAQNPGLNKQFSEIIYIFSEQNFTDLSAKMTCDTSSIPAEDIIIPNNPGGWGISAWGPTYWGGGPVGQGKVRRYVPQAVQRCGWLIVNISNAEAFTSFGLSGIEIFFKPTSSRQK